MSKYNEKTVGRILSLIRHDTYIVPEICRQAGIAKTTFYRWQEEHPEFAEAIEEAREERLQQFVKEAERSLLKRIQGYDVTETRVVTVPTRGNPSKPTIKEQTSTKKHVQPDTTAIIFALTNGDPTRWRNKHSAELTGKDGKALFEGLSNEALAEQIAELQRKLSDE